MVIGPDFSREMRSGEEGEVDALLRAAFPGPEEAKLVRDLRASGQMVAEMVTPWQDRIAAYAAVSRMVAPEGWICLAPVAVWPEWQRGALGRNDGDSRPNPYHFGTRLVSMLVTVVRNSSVFSIGSATPTLVVLGKPSFYARCGFSLERAERLTSPYPIANTLIARSGDDTPEATLVYPAAFDGV
ncbi:MAG: N-acetyltransferase [Tabrizicola sp.]|uniref:GNAT family N-acetyltransferase n=1 Tax=Tabrizicola sp. TaxID=2005166 RepID=UPI002AB933A7|nr:N-acetyltransferase [Tabrizicola sp.]MDZ4088547.1 N-acetyltransferase [Tabrizicola sp.]